MSRITETAGQRFVANSQIGAPQGGGEGSTMKLFRRRLSVGQPFRSEDGSVDGLIIAVWPMEKGSEVLVRLTRNGAEIRAFVPSKTTTE